MNEELEKDYQQKIKLIKNKTNVLHFSTGADSVACFLRLREAGIEPILVYKYFLRDLPMVNNYIDYFEKKFNVHIYKFPHTLWAEMIDNALFQKPIKAREKFRNNIGQYYLDYYTKDVFDDQLREALGGDVIFHIGIRYTDGLHRYLHLKKNGCMFQDKFYPIAPFKVSDIQDLLDKYNCYLPIEYGLWGISFESPRAWNFRLIKDNCPETYKKILDTFPMIGAEMYRDDYSKLNQHFKSRLSQFKRFAIPKEMYPIW